MNLKNISNLDLTDRLVRLHRTERKITHIILLHINEFVSRKLYAEYGYATMYEYLTKKLGYDEHSAYRRLQAAKPLQQIPQASVQLAEGKIKLSQLVQVQKCLSAEKKKGEAVSAEKTYTVLKKLENQTIFKTKQILAAEFDLPVLEYTQITPQKDDSVRLEITLTKQQFEELKTAQNLLSHICYSGELSEVIATLATKFNQSKLGQKKDTSFVAGFNDEQKTLNSGQPINQFSSDLTQGLITTPKSQTNLSRRKYISIKTKRSLLQSADRCCEYESLDSKRCTSKYQLQIDHIVPLAKGGANHPNNFRILCRTHNQLMARRWGL